MQEEIKIDPQDCPDLTGKPLGIKNCFAAFLVMMVGIVSAIVLLIIEKFLKGKTTETNQNQHNSIEDNPEENPADNPVEHEPSEHI